MGGKPHLQLTLPIFLYLFSSLCLARYADQQAHYLKDGVAFWWDDEGDLADIGAMARSLGARWQLSRRRLVGGEVGQIDAGPELQDSARACCATLPMQHAANRYHLKRVHSLAVNA